MDAITILIAEDHEMTRKGLAYSLTKLEWVKAVIEADDGGEALALFKDKKPDVILMDIGLPVCDGIKTTQAIKGISDSVKIIMLTSHGEEHYVLSAFQAGADGYCMKDIKSKRLVQVIEMVCEGAVWLDPSVAQFVLNRFATNSSLNTSPSTNESDVIAVQLTEREKDILRLMADGMSNKQIGETLSISIYTVKNHVSNVINKLAVDDRTQAALRAVKEGLI